MTTIQAPRTPSRSTRKRGINWDKYGWIYMRASGVLLIVLILGHLFVNLILGEGIKQIDFAFVGGKYSAPFWQIWDLLMLWLALIHGTNGMRTIINDYIHNRMTGRVLKGAMFIAAAILIVLGTLVIFTFDPCPAGAPANLVADFCSAK
ncbi:MAG: succinate dehydrogenase, hydrophobic membrane anchor protein [Microbacteriaceae bacterium]